MVKVPDERLDRLADLVKAKKTTYLELRLLDFPSFSVGKKGPPPQLLGELSTADLVVHVVHAFESDSVPHPLDSVDPARDVAALDMELCFADLGIVERRMERLAAEMRSVAAGARGAQERELALLSRLKEALESEQPLRGLALSGEEQAMLSGFNLISAKPLLVVLNVDEDGRRAGRGHRERSAGWLRVRRTDRRDRGAGAGRGGRRGAAARGSGRVPPRAGPARGAGRRAFTAGGRDPARLHRFLHGRRAGHARLVHPGRYGGSESRGPYSL